MAPRFLYKGSIIWLKASPWIISSATLFGFFLFASRDKSPEIYAHCILGFLIQLIQFIVCIIKSETPVSFLLKPFENEVTPNLLGSINLSDPNADLNSIFGPPVSVPSGVPGQRSPIVRYGSQAVKSGKGKQYQANASANYSSTFASQSPPSYPVETNSNSASSSKSNFDSKV